MLRNHSLFSFLTFAFTQLMFEDCPSAASDSILLFQSLKFRHSGSTAISSDNRDQMAAAVLKRSKSHLLSIFSTIRASSAPLVALSPDIEAAHRAACERSDAMYTDPATGYAVFTEASHVVRGTCCGSACRHCPFGHFAVKVEGMRKSRLLRSAVLRRQRRKGERVHSYQAAVVLCNRRLGDCIDLLLAQASCAPGGHGPLLVVPFHPDSYVLAAIASDELGTSSAMVAATPEAKAISVEAAFDVALACGVDVLAVAAGDPSLPVTMAEIRDAAARLTGVRLLPTSSDVLNFSAPAAGGSGASSAATAEAGSAAVSPLLWRAEPLGAVL